MESENNMIMEPRLCAKGCGFYGSVENKNMCSKCYNDHLKQENVDVDVYVDVVSAMVASMDKLDLGSITSGIALPAFENSDSSASAPTSSRTCTTSECESAGVKNRCQSCNKKVGVLGFHCRCSGVFCGRHRYPEEHSCNVDLKKAGRDLLAKQNPVCKGEKLEWKI